MHLIWFEKAWKDYLYWQTQDKKTLKKINEIIKDIERSAGKGIGKGELLKGDLSVFSSKRIDKMTRLVYRISESNLEIASCKNHY